MELILKEGLREYFYENGFAAKESVMHEQFLEELAEYIKNEILCGYVILEQVEIDDFTHGAELISSAVSQIEELSDFIRTESENLEEAFTD